MAQKNMPGTPKQRSVGRPAQGAGPSPDGVRKTALSTKGIALQTPTFKAAKKRTGSLVTK